jgi:hypothetical protein
MKAYICKISLEDLEKKRKEFWGKYLSLLFFNLEIKND